MDFKEFEKKAHEAQEAAEVQEAAAPAEITPEEIDQAGAELHAAAQRATLLLNPELNDREAGNFAHSPLFADYISDLQGDPEQWRQEYQGIAGELKRAAQEAQEALDAWQQIRERFFNSKEWQKLQQAFKDITPADGETLLDIPAFTWQVIDLLPEIQQEIKAHEKATGSKLQFRDLLIRQAGDLPDAADPREMLLSIFLKRADKKKRAAEIERPEELLSRRTEPVTALSRAIRAGGIIGAGEQRIIVRNAKKKRPEVAIYGQLHFDFPELQQEEGKKAEEAFFIANTIRGDIKILGSWKDSPLSADIRNTIYSLVMTWKLSGRNWRNLYFDEKDIFRQQHHTKKDPGDRMKTEIIKTLAAQKFLEVELDLTNHFQMLGRPFINPNTGEPALNCIYQGPLLSLEQFIFNKGEPDEYRLYHLANYPIELAYAEQTGQIRSYPADLLDVKEVRNGKITENSLSITETRIALRNYILKIVFDMKYELSKAREDLRKYKSRKKKDGEDKELKDFLPIPYRAHFRMLFDTMFKESGLINTDRETQRQQRNFAFQVLDFLQARGVIKGYKQVTKGRKIAGIDLEL